MPTPAEDLHARFQPDYTPEQLENLGVYDALYRGQAPRLASLGAWKPEWISEHDPKGWAQWYKRYVGGRRIEGEDERQIRRWLNFKSRHGGPFAKKPTARRGWALRNWAIDPSKLVPEQAQNINELLAEHQRKAMQKFVQQKVAHKIENARAHQEAVFPVSGLEQLAEAEPGQASCDAPALSKQADLNPDVQLQEHQQRVSDRITDSDPRLLLYHGLGTGKSLSAIAAAEAAKKVHGGQYGVVVPASLKQNFQKELSKFTSGSNPEIMSYTGLALGKKFQQPPETLVMDEAQRLKNPESASAIAARNLAAQAKRVVLLSGTPITNSPGDLASPLSILRNENISPEDFEKKYVGYEKKFPGIIPYLRGADYGEEPFVKNEPQLRDMLAGKVDYQPGKLPEGVRVNEETIKVPLSPEQRRIQKAVRTKIPPGFLWKLDQEFPLSREELAKLNSFMTGMRQVSLSTQPFRADKSPIKAFEQSSKLREAMKRLRENLDADPRRKAIIYSNFIDAGINPYAAALEREKIPYGVFHGGIAARARQKALADYNAGKLRALLLGPAAAEGISTKGTSLIQLLDPYWHESRTQQARGRGLRFDSHAGLPDDLKDVSVQRYLSASEEPHFLARLIGRRRERTGDEVMQHLADKKEQLNEKFRQILREVGSEKAGAYQFAVKLAGWLSDKVNAPAPPPAIPQPPPKLTNQHFRPPRPAAATTGTVAGSYKVAPKPGPAQPKLPMRTGVPVASVYNSAYQRWKDPTAASWHNWIDRNYSSPGDARHNAHDQIAAHVAATPGAQKQYQAVTEQMFTRARAQARQRFIPENSAAPLIRSHVASGGGLPPLLVVGTSDQYIGQNRAWPYSLAAAAGRAAGLSSGALSAVTAGKTRRLPAMSRGIVGVHEMEHVNQNLENINNETLDATVGPLIPRPAYAEPAAVLNEMVHATDAAHQVTGKPVPGEFALTDNYKPKLEWMRQQALQHGLQNMGPAGTGNKTMQELLNTPEGQKWLQMQIDNMPEQSEYRYSPQDRAFIKMFDALKSALREKQNQAHITKAAASFGSPVIRQAVGKALPYLTGSGAMAAGGGVAGWAGNDAFLNEYHPKVTNLGRLRSNLRAATMGAASGLLAKGRVKNPGLAGGTLAGLGLALRYGVVTPSRGPLALGDYTDPGHAAIPKFLAWHAKPENQQQAKDILADPVQHGTNWGFDKLYDYLKKQLVDDRIFEARDGTKVIKPAPGQIEAGKQLREEALPATYSAVLEALGAPVKQKTVRDAATGQDKKVPDVQFADIGTALAPHLAGGAGGAYLGYRLGDTVGNFLFPDSDKDEYESRRRQENRRWWLQFLGGNLGAVGGTVAAIKAMPQLREIMRDVYAKQPGNAAAAAAKQAAQHVTQKTAAGRFNMSTLIQALRPRATAALQGAGQFAKNRAVDLGYGAGITAGQYALNQAVPGYIPSAEFNDKGEQAKAVTDPWFISGLTALNAAASRPWRKALSGVKPSFTSIWPSGTFLTAGPSLVYPFTHVKKLYDTAKVMNPLEKEHYSDKSLPSLYGAVKQPLPTLKRVGEIAKKKLEASNWQADTTKALEGIAHEAGVPGFDDKEHSAAKFLGSAGWGTLGQGAGIATGGVAGMVGGDWLADTVLSQAVKRKWLKKRPGMHKFIRDLSSLAGAGLGAYGGLRALNAATPAVMKYYASKMAPAASAQAATTDAAPVSA